MQSAPLLGKNVSIAARVADAMPRRKIFLTASMERHSEKYRLSRGILSLHTCCAGYCTHPASQCKGDGTG
jgi:hypothetical protein